MLETRRVLELGNRVYWYMIWFCVGIFTYYFFGLYYDINNEYLIFISKILSTILFFSLVFGIWIIVFSLALFLKDKILPTRILLLSFFRILIIIALDILYSMIINLAGKTIII